MTNEEYFKQREDAIAWWNTLSDDEKQQWCIDHRTMVGELRRPETLTGREIQILYAFATV